MRMIRAAGAGERGFTLIEILIAVIVLAIGLLGVAGLQTVSMQQTAASDSRSVAIMHAQTMAERIRSIRGVPADGDVEAQGTNGAVISLQWVERMNRLDPSSAGQDGEVVRDPVVSNFTLNVRYRE